MTNAMHEFSLTGCQYYVVGRYGALAGLTPPTELKAVLRDGLATDSPLLLEVEIDRAYPLLLN
jgi:hypothetical protein